MALPKFIRDDWPRKLAALVFATLIWYSVYRQIQEPVTFRDLPVTLHTGSTLAITNRDQMPRITITIRGSQRALNKVASNDIRISQVLPEDTAPGPYQIRLKAGDVAVPGRLQVTRIEPDTFTVNVDRQITANLPIRVPFTGELPDGWAIKNITVSPPRVNVTGPESLVKGLVEVTTEAIQRNWSNPEIIETVVKLEVPPQVAIDSSNARVKIEHLRKNDNRFFSSLNVVVVNRPDSDLYVAEFIDTPTPTIEANVMGPKATLDNLADRGSVLPFVDISDRATPGEVVLPIFMWIDGADCRVVSSRPTSLRVRLKRRLPDVAIPATAPLPVSPTMP